jgi:hypothetical protein
MQKEFERLVSETRIGGHSIYFVTNKQQWCIRLTQVYRAGQSVAFINKNLHKCFNEACEYIKENRVLDNQHHRPYRMKLWEEYRNEMLEEKPNPMPKDISNMCLWYMCDGNTTFTNLEGEQQELPCKNTALIDAKPKEPCYCGGTFRLMKKQKAYMANHEDWEHPEGEI